MKKILITFTFIVFCLTFTGNSYLNAEQVLPEKTDMILTSIYEDIKITIAFDGNRVYGFSGVNRYSGSYEINNGKIKFSSMGSTMMAGPEKAMDAERDYLNLLHSADNFTFDGKILTIGTLSFKLND